MTESNKRGISFIWSSTKYIVLSPSTWALQQCWRRVKSYNVKVRPRACKNNTMWIFQGSGKPGHASSSPTVLSLSSTLQPIATMQLRKTLADRGGSLLPFSCCSLCWGSHPVLIIIVFIFGQCQLNQNLPKLESQTQPRVRISSPNNINTYM